MVWQMKFSAAYTVRPREDENITPWIRTDVLGVDGVVDDTAAWPGRFNILFLKWSDLAGEIPGGPLSPPRQAHIFKPRSVPTINLDSE
jgi:hypothetical protein